MVSADPALAPALLACPGAGLKGWPRGRGGTGRIPAPSGADALRSLAQSALRARTASMTDALLPAAPQALEKESDSYFRKVGGCGWAGSLPRAPYLLQPGCGGGLRECAAGVDQAGRGRGRTGLGRAGQRLLVWAPAAVYPAAQCRWLPGLGAGSCAWGQPHAGGGGGWGPGGVLVAAPAGSPTRPGKGSMSSLGDARGIVARWNRSPPLIQAFGGARVEIEGSSPPPPSGLAFSFCLQNGFSVRFFDF